VRSKLGRGLTWLGVALLLAACSDEHPPRPSGDAGAGNSSAGGKGGASDSNGDAGAEAGVGGDSNVAGALLGEGGSAGSGAQAGSGGSLGHAGEGGEPTPPVGDPPVCLHDATWSDHTKLAISAPGDDLLQAVTHSGNTIAWKNGDTFYIADRDLDYVLKPGDRGLPFDSPLPVAGSAAYSSVALSPDGLTLIALRHDLTVVELARNAGEAFDDASPGPGDFADFNGTLATIPAANQVLCDPVMSADGEAFFFSHFADGQSGSHATVYESRRSGGAWQYGSSNLGGVLVAQDDARRIPTGVSVDLLTLFYRDEVEGDFRAAWRVNPTVPFTRTETLAFGETAAAAPNSACTTIHYSAQGENDLDLFVTYRD
jgi:hypothetical protein